MQDYISDKKCSYSQKSLWGQACFYCAKQIESFLAHKHICHPPTPFLCRNETTKDQAFCGRLLQGWIHFFLLLLPNKRATQQGTKPQWFFTQISVWLSIPCNWLRNTISKENSYSKKIAKIYLRIFFIYKNIKGIESLV